MSKPTWVTPKDLGIIEDGVYFEKQLFARSADNSEIFYQVISGNLAPGVQLALRGVLMGVPNLANSGTSDINYISTFTVRAQNSRGEIADRSFKFIVSGVQPPTIYSTTSNLGQYYDGSYFDYQLVAVDNYPVLPLTWRKVRGRLPPGITLSSDGRIQGFLNQNIIDISAFNNIGWNQTKWDIFIWDFVAKQNNIDYEFTVELTDGINYVRQNYLIRVIARDLLTADVSVTQLNDTGITVDQTPMHLPFILTMPQTLPEIRLETARQDTYFAFKFEAVDLDGDEITYEITSPDQRGFDQDGDNENHSYGVGFDTQEFDSSEYTMPLYIGLNNETGWYTGHIARQVENRQDFTFQIYAVKKRDITLRGIKSTFVVSVLGQVTENITWVTESDLGSIENGAISSLQVLALNSSGKNLVYYLKSGVTSRTPQGVVLQRNGMLSGRVSFEYFQLDADSTTIDRGKTTFEKTYEFTVVAQTSNRSAYSERTFTLKVHQVNKKPFENLYLKGFPNRDQRILYKSIIDNQNIFPDQLIYRLGDPWYGKSADLRFLFMPGINPAELGSYIQAMSKNHYTKTVLFGDVKTAVALDQNYKPVYEVVYLDVIDEQEGKDPVTGLPKAPAQTIDISRNKYKVVENGQVITEITPNALGNMRVRIEETIGLANANTLPLWMTCPQPDPENPKKYNVPLGYVRAVILAYTVPGASKLIAYRLKNANFLFNRIPFRVDRYQLDNYLSRNYEIDLEKYIPSAESTIDAAPSVAERYRNKGSVTYAVTVPFEKINNQRVDYIQYWSCMDGISDFKSGDTLIFAQQENFQSDQPNQYANYDVYGQKYPNPSQDIRVWPHIKISAGLPEPYQKFDSDRFVNAFDNDYFDHGALGYTPWLVNDGERIPYNKWVYWTDGWLTTLPFDSELYGSTEFSKSVKVPGFVEHIFDGIPNQRAGVYKINIDDSNIVTLSLVRNTNPGDIVEVERGVTYGPNSTRGPTRLYFESYTRRGNVPRWWKFEGNLIIDPDTNDSLVKSHKETTFDQRGTRFFNYRDQYAGPEEQAKYIKFPKYGVFI